ncbi:Rrf2 family transcriptional regulator [uncultured Parvimonas sp.]|uniref:Rrf2 family transcriptional regulator n=1 Tax=uncultured Parvimonas sp. TaxID=747372 RepID=UPI0028D778D0|nr:Rrf2 family transcriptional regulator [uncultured Parvimonas sp.]
MQISSRFTLAIHILVAADIFEDEYKVTSELMASSSNANSVTIRKIMKQLKEAGIINVKRGPGGIELSRPKDQITLLDIFNAVESLEDGKLFRFHENPNKMCPVGRNIHASIDEMLDSIQNEMEDALRKYTLQDAIVNTRLAIEKE